MRLIPVRCGPVESRRRAGRGLSLTLRTRVLAVFGALAAAALLAIVLLGSAGQTRLRSARLVERCRPGTVQADGDVAGGVADQHRACVPLGEPETFSDLAQSNSELASRDTAPFSSQAPGAYLHALAQSRNLPTTAGVWKLAGKPPECAAQTSGSSSCPAPNSDNGLYGYTGSLGFRTLSGRISSYAYDPSTQGRYFASPVVGGVWESRNGGTTWRSIGDGLPTQAVGAIAYDAPLHRLLVGTGDNSFGQDGIAGHGLYYSSNDGATWRLARGIPDLSLTFKIAVSGADHSGRTIYAATSKGLFRSVNGGASFINEDLPTSPSGYTPNCKGNTTARLCFFANVVTDVLVKPTTTANGHAGAVIAAVGWRAGQKPDLAPNGNSEPGCKMNGSPTTCLQAPQNGLYTSGSGAPGSFHHIPGGNGLPTSFAPTNVVGRTALAEAHGAGQNSDAVYALVEDAQKFNGCPDILDTPPPKPGCNATVNGEAVATVLDGMYASYDFGRTWTKVMDWKQLRQPGTNSSLTAEAGYSPGVQAWYNLWVEPDPTRTDASTKDPTRLLFGLEEVWENNPALPSAGAGGVLATPYPAYPGGTAATDPWVVIGRYWNACGGFNTPVGPCNPNPFTGGVIPGSTVHPDQHAYAMIPDHKGGGVTLLIGSDGGAYKQHVAAGQNFSNDNWGNGLNATLPTVQPYDAEMSKDGTIVSGLQDNGELKIARDGREAEIYGGDAFYTTIDPKHSNNIIEEYTYAEQVNLSKDGGATWYPIQPSQCGSSSTALFSTPIEQDPTMDGHVLIGCTQIQEGTNVYANPCAAPAGASASNCQATNVPFTTVYDLSTAPSPNGAPNIPSALAVRGKYEYAAYCGYCDPATQSLPFANGIATNVGGKVKPKIGTSNGWHLAALHCAGCGTANGKLPERYITSIQEDPKDPNTVYVTLGGYGRRWIPPGSFGESTRNVGVGHLFVSHDHGNHFTNISGNLPDIPANWTAVHDGQLIVATDLGVYIQLPGGGHRYAVLGRGLPRLPVFTVRVSPADPNVLLVATYGRGDFLYRFGGSSAKLTLSDLRVIPQAFTAGGSPRVRYVDSRAASTTFTVFRRHGRGLVKVGSFSHRDHAGINNFDWTGKLNGKLLSAGSYVLRATARLGRLVSNTASTTFTVKRS